MKKIAKMKYVPTWHLGTMAPSWHVPRLIYCFYFLINGYMCCEFATLHISVLFPVKLYFSVLKNSPGSQEKMYIGGYIYFSTKNKNLFEPNRVYKLVCFFRMGFTNDFLCVHVILEIAARMAKSAAQSGSFAAVEPCNTRNLPLSWIKI